MFAFSDFVVLLGGVGERAPSCKYHRNKLQEIEGYENHLKVW